MNELLLTNHPFARRVPHLPACTGADLYETTGARGDRMLRCRSCGRFAVLPATVATPAQPQDAPRTPEEAAPAPKVTPGRYVCGEHPDEPVSWKGTGCCACRDERRRR